MAGDFDAQKHEENTSKNSESDFYYSDQDPEYIPNDKEHKFKVN